LRENFELDLFNSKRSIFIFIAITILILIYNIFIKYQIYNDIKTKRVQEIKATVLNQYIKQKGAKKYTVLKLKAYDGYTFYTTNYKNLQNMSYHDISLKIITDKLKFIDLFRGFYTFSYNIKIIDKDHLFLKIKEFIHNQHEDPITKELYSALFLATPISKELREKVSNLGISHLVAISGFHLGVLSFIIYFILSYPYKIVHYRYFPYRNKKFDIGIITIVILFTYLYFLGFIPSLTRAFIMLLVGFILYDRYIKILSFEVLFVAVILILAFIPSFIFSIGFWFSVSGVFYIYIFLIYFKDLKPWKIVIALNIWVYIAMIPIIHSIFTKFTIYQLLSPALSIAFTIFYPLQLFLHIIDQGSLLDSMVICLLEQDSTHYHIKTPIWVLTLYLTLSMVIVLKKYKKS
jgi:competence protein ComEC